MDLTKSQQLVIDTKNKSLLVSASAGSGKTFVVVERLVKEIIEGVDVDSLLVLTFTNAAASELKERIVNKLYEIRDMYEKEKNIEQARRITKQISKIPAADISTIHSFCLSVIRNNFFVLGIDPNVSTLDETKAGIMLQESILEVIEKEYEEQSPEFLDVLDMTQKEEVLIEQLNRVYNAYRNAVNREKWLEDIRAEYACEESVNDLTETIFGKLIMQNIKEKLVGVSLELKKLIEDMQGVKDFLTRKSVLEEMLTNIQKAIAINSYDNLYNFLPILVSSKNLPSTTVLDDELKEQTKKIKNKVTAELKKIQLIMYKDSRGITEELRNSYKYADWICNAINSIDVIYTAKKQEKVGIDFSDYEHLALEVLQHEDIRKTYLEKYTRIYIDEYQDTSYIQDTIISKISKSNNIIMVGDVKQSIYGFRNAKPELFTEKYNTFKEVQETTETHAKIILAKNFRSREEVIKSVNMVFAMLMSEKFGGASYGKKEALVYGEGYKEDTNGIYKTELHIIEKKDNEVEKQDSVTEDDSEPEVVEDISNLKAEAIAVSNRIKQLLKENFKVYDLKKQEYRKCEYKDIVILMRSIENKANIVSDVLRENGIPAYSDSKTGFYKSDEVSIVISFLKILDNIFDDISLVSVMYSIIGKFTLDELVEIRNKQTQIPFIDSIRNTLENTKNELLKQKLQDFTILIERYKKYIKTFSLAEVILKLYLETGIYQAMRFEELGELKCANLDALVQVVDEYEKSELSCSLFSLLTYIDLLKSKESAGDSPKLLGENENVVRIMTMHKSKGLEFPVVILMDTAGVYNQKDLSNKILTDEEMGIGLDVLNKELNITYPSVIKQVIKEKIRRNLREEAMRLLYVAMTRAKEKLIIFGTVSSLDSYTKDLVVTEDNRISHIFASSLNSHLQVLMQALVLNKKEDILVECHKRKEYVKANFENKKDLLDRTKSKINVLKNLVEENEIKIDKEYIKEFEDNLCYEYPFSDATRVEQKYTVTELKKKSENKKAYLETNLESLRPKTLEPTLNNTSYGTFVHEVIEKIDFTNMSVEAILEQATKLARYEGIEEKVNLHSIAKKVYTMYEKFKNVLKEADNIQKELEFVVLDDLNNIPDLKLGTKTLIQGVVDMLVTTKEGKNVIIDFKTDRVENEQELIDRYKYQLLVYKRAIEVVYKRKVSNMYIYSFSLDKRIEVIE